jgi:hypothetical protein
MPLYLPVMIRISGYFFFGAGFLKEGYFQLMRSQDELWALDEFHMHRLLAIQVTALAKGIAIG